MAECQHGFSDPLISCHDCREAQKVLERMQRVAESGNEFGRSSERPRTVARLDEGILAQYDGRCVTCGGDIEAGFDMITGTDDGYAHVECD